MNYLKPKFSVGQPTQVRQGTCLACVYGDRDTHMCRRGKAKVFKYVPQRDGGLPAVWYVDFQGELARFASWSLAVRFANRVVGKYRKAVSDAATGLGQGKKGVST